MSTTEMNGDPFIKSLLSLLTADRRKNSKGEPDRAALAALRSGLRDRLNDPYDVGKTAKYIAPYLDDGGPKAYEWYSVIGSLFAYAQPDLDCIPRKSLGWVLGLLRTSPDASDSLDARFTAMLSSRTANLPGHLRHAISLLKAKSSALQANQRGIDWELLLDNALDWDLSDRSVQTQWAKDYYAAIRMAGKNTDNTSDNEEEESE